MCISFNQHTLIEKGTGTRTGEQTDKTKPSAFDLLSICWKSLKELAQRLGVDLCECANKSETVCALIICSKSAHIA